MKLVWEKGDDNLLGALDQHFSDDSLVARLQTLFEGICNYKSYGPRPLHDFWSKMNEIDRYRQALYVHLPNDLYTVLLAKYESYNEELKKTRQDEIMKQTMYKTKEENKYKRTKEEFTQILKKCDHLCVPKDKWKTGRVMLGLKKKYNFDSILKKMIKQEFKENKKFKFPEEYAVYDSDEENDRKRIMFQQKSETPHERNIIEKEKEQRILDKMHKFKIQDDEDKTSEQRALEKLHKEDLDLEKYLKKQCVAFLRIIEARLQTKDNGSINKFLTKMYSNMKANYKSATKRRFPYINYDKKKKKRFNDYPLDLKIYFFNLLRRITYEQKGDGVKIKFGRENVLAFWAPSGSNQCKVHRSYCPLYCKYNTHNKYIKTQRKVNFNNLHPVKELNQAERLHLWKRNELAKEKTKIFLCFSEVEHCTFEPRLNIQKEGARADNPEEVVAKRLSNKEWVLKMGDNFQKRFPLIHKEGQLKVAKIAYQGGDFTKAMKIINSTFDIEQIKCHFDKKYQEAYKKRKKEEELKKQQAGEETKSSNPFDNNQFMKFGEKEIVIVPDDFTVPKNNQICSEVYDIVLDIEGFKKDKKREAKRIEDEVKLIKGSKLDKMSDTLKSVSFNSTTGIQLVDTMANTKISMAQTNYIKDKYFKLFKSIMCPLK